MAVRWVIILAAAVGLAQDFEYLYRQAYEERKTPESARDLALYLASRGEFSRAAPHLEAAVELADSEAGATALHNWAVALEERQPAVAERMYRKVLRIRVKEDAEQASTRLNLAALVMGRGDGEAEKLAGAALATFEKKLGPADARTGAACSVLGAAMATRGDVAGAERLFRRALTIAEKAHGGRSAETASALENLADLLGQTGRESAARPLLDRAEKIRAVHANPVIGERK